MQITEIKRCRGHLCEVHFDNGECVLLDSDFVAEKSILTGKSVTAHEVRQFKNESDYRRAVSRSVWYIERGDLSEKSLYQKLKKAGYTDAASSAAVSRMKELSLINDVSYAERLAERLLAGAVSRREALFKMANKGLPRDIAAAALDMFECDPCEQIRALINKKYRTKLADPESVKKVFAALSRKGFSYGDIKTVLKEYSDELKYSEEQYGL